MPKPYWVSIVQGLFLAGGFYIPLGPQQDNPPRTAVASYTIVAIVIASFYALSWPDPSQGLEFDLLGKLQQVIPRSAARVVFQPLGFVGIRGCIQHHVLGTAGTIGYWLSCEKYGVWSLAIDNDAWLRQEQ